MAKSKNHSSHHQSKYLICHIFPVRSKAAQKRYIPAQKTAVPLFEWRRSEILEEYAVRKETQQTLKEGVPDKNLVYHHYCSFQLQRDSVCTGRFTAASGLCVPPRAVCAFF
ncbi:hypothetical protein SprV_0100030900 [Sparganum proliferum]